MLKEKGEKHGKLNDAEKYPHHIWDNVMRKKTEYSYGVLASIYHGEEPCSYYKITMPVPKDRVRMFGMDISMKYNYTKNFFAKLFVNVTIFANQTPSVSPANRVEILSNNPDVLSKVEVYFQSPANIWIKATGSYLTCTIDRIFAQDNMRYIDVTNTTIEKVTDSLPTVETIKLTPKALLFT